MSFLEKNKNILLNQYKGLFEEISAGSDDDLLLDEDIKIENAQSGELTLCIKGVYVHSQRDPLRESRRLAETVNAECGFAVFLGFGLGYAAEAAAEIKQDLHTIIIVEKHKKLLLKALELRDFSGFLSNNRIMFIIGGTGEGITNALGIASDYTASGTQEKKTEEKRLAPTVIRNIALTNIDEKWYRAVDDRIRAWSVKDDVNLATHKRFGQRWVRNLSHNMNAIRDYPGVSRLEGLAIVNEQGTKAENSQNTNRIFTEHEPSVHRALPVFLAAAGPSLDKIKPLLNEIHERCIIVAVDTSLRFFVQNGIQPDFTVVVDPQFWNCRHLDRCVSEDLKTALIAESAVYPPVLKLPFKNIFLCASMFPLGAFIEKQVDSKGRLAAGGSVATTAWDFARILGSREIWIAGLDLAFPGFKTHFRGARFETISNSKSNRFSPAEKWVMRALRDGFPFKAQSASGGQVLTDKRLSLYAAWFENQFRQFSETQNFCLFQEGIYIKGLQSASLEKFLALPSRRKEINLRKKEAFIKIENEFNNTDVKKRRAELYDNAVNELKSEMENIKNEAARGMETARAALAAQHDVFGSVNLSQQEKIYKELNVITQNINENSVKEITDFLLPLVDEEKEEGSVENNKDSFQSYLKLCFSMLSRVVKAAEIYLIWTHP